MIYLIHPDVLHYQTFVIDSKEARRKLGDDTSFHFDQRPIQYQSTWQPLDIQFANMSKGQAKPLPDISVRHGRLFLNEKAHERLYPLIKNDGELLPVTYGQQKGYLFNILTIAESSDAVNKELSTKDKYGELTSIAFHEERLKDAAIFRAEFDNYLGIYCRDEFARMVNQHELTGIAFSADLGNIYPPDPAAQDPKSH